MWERRQHFNAISIFICSWNTSHQSRGSPRHRAAEDIGIISFTKRNISPCLYFWADYWSWIWMGDVYFPHEAPSVSRICTDDYALLYQYESFQDTVFLISLIFLMSPCFSRLPLQYAARAQAQVSLKRIFIFEKLVFSCALKPVNFQLLEKAGV